MRKLVFGGGVVALLAILLQGAGFAQSAGSEMALLSRIAQQPGDVANYLELAKVYRANKRFDEAEQMLLRALELLREERRTGQTIGASPTAARPQGTVQGYPGGVQGGYPDQAPLRVGGDIKEPKKIRDVKPVYPELAQQSRVMGIVILEATIDRNGFVREARVLRSVPLLDQAAVDAVLQWQFTPTLLNGVPVEVIMTVTVNFTLN
jgi:TonB family protein